MHHKSEGIQGDKKVPNERVGKIGSNNMDLQAHTRKQVQMHMTDKVIATGKGSKYRVFFWSLLSCIGTEYGDLRNKSPYSVRIQENKNQKNSIFGHFSPSAFLKNLQFKVFTIHFSYDTSYFAILDNGPITVERFVDGEFYKICE